MATPGTAPPVANGSSSVSASNSFEKPRVPDGHPAGYAQNGVGGTDFSNQGRATHWDYGGNPLAHANTGESARLPPFAGYLQPGMYRPSKKNLGNPAPMGLVAFALTTFLLSLVNWHTRHIAEPSIVIGPAFAYGGLVQLLAGMWEMALGNTFGATALGSYGGLWISLAIVLTPGGFNIAGSCTNPVHSTTHSDSSSWYGWFIFTFILWICTLKSTVVFSALFFCVWMTFLLLGISYLLTPDVTGGAQNTAIQKAGGMFGLLAAFLAWYVALAGIADSSNSFFTVLVWHFPWSDKGRAAREKTDELRA
ncbi:related to Y.lipolytica glyoxylate pathway regulator GPR1 [Phialocephala subalpina]|uniref:Related to Y.lipolytica glyoxylate pathway regulator GPR1 n=1 Tax=Phialocephala subalpina TaxID=576137 RepID=A0A1L7WF00_9HELO|nr:related to Y.lipolytica glyoxylate pathway regulator GPR1 [Phialocephala subalpina]